MGAGHSPDTGYAGGRASGSRIRKPPGVRTTGAAGAVPDGARYVADQDRDPRLPRDVVVSLRMSA